VTKILIERIVQKQASQLIENQLFRKRP